MGFLDKVVIVTGASSGIGAAIAVAFAKERANVVVVGRNQNKLETVVKMCEDNGKKPLVLIADVSTEQGVKRIVDETVNHFKKIDVLVNNAGIGSKTSILEENALKSFDQVLGTNLRAAVYLTHLVAPHLVKSNGNIINISSVASTGVFAPNNFTYCTSKAALDHFTRSVALELASSGVRVNTVNPGPVKTDFLENLIPDEKEIAKAWDAMKQRTALGNISEPKEIADLVLYLASEKAKSITGASFVIDNGMLLKG